MTLSKIKENNKTLDIQIDKNYDVKTFRNNLNDIEKLANSIRTNGLINPVIIIPIENDNSYQLLSGARRILAAKSLGWKTIPAKIVHTMVEACDALIEEAETNIATNPLLPSEKVAMGLMIEKLKAPNFDKSAHKTREKQKIIAPAIDLTPSAYERIRYLTLAQNDPNPEIRSFSKEALKRIDQGNAIKPEERKLNDMKQNFKPLRNTKITDTQLFWQQLEKQQHKTAQEAYNEFNNNKYASMESFRGAGKRHGVTFADTKQTIKHRRHHSKMLERSIESLESYTTAIIEENDFSAISKEQLEDTLERFTIIQSNIRRIIQQIKKETK